jgi:DNA replication protein DnaC
LSDFDRKIVDAVLAALAKTKEGLFIVGPVGSGKTHLAAAILRSRYEIGKSAKFVRAANLYRAIRESYQVGYIGLTEEQILNTYGTSEFLIIDDLAAGSLSDHERRIALEVIDIRMNRLLQTVVTSNLLVEDIRKQMDERIASRLQSFIKIALTTTVDWRVRAKM